MPKNEIDYSNTVIYKIICRDENIKDLYVGHTTNFIKRKYLHKNSCNNLNNKLKIYKIIRENGGWNNWEMIEIAVYNCKDNTEARIKEQEHYELLKATLNSCPPFVDKQKYFCKTCKKQYNSKYDYDLHIKCKSHIKKLLCESILQKTDAGPFESSKKISCHYCDYSTSRKSQYDRHISTLKHKNTVKILTATDIKSSESSQSSLSCECGKIYKHRQSLFTHKKKCLNTESNIQPISLDKDELIKYLIKENTEFKEMIVEQNKVVMKMCENNNSTINNNINSHNKTFNLNVFLNEHCKDAMNIMDFVDSLKLQLSDLENVGKLGFVEGISNIIVKNLKALDVHKRPVHCSDSKREVMYIKDEDKWEKENDDKNKLRKAIKRVANKNSRLLPEFKEKHPDCGKSSSAYSDQYNKLIVEAMGGSGNEDIDNENKIIKKIAKEVVIDKNNV